MKSYDSTDGYISTETNEIKTRLAKLVGQTVCVSWVKYRKSFSADVALMHLASSTSLPLPSLAREPLRHNFETQISVQANLEGSAETGKFRVLVNDNTYAYFHDENVWSVLQDLENNKRAVIYIN